MSNGRNTDSQDKSNLRPTAKRSPSILVTDARSSNVKGARAPFAGQNYRKQQQQQSLGQLGGSNYSDNRSHPLTPSLHRRFNTRSNKYTDISVDKLLSNSSDIPSGQSRFPNSAQNARFPSPRPSLPPIDAGLLQEQRRRNIRSIPKLSQNLPARTSKTSQKLVLIPDEHQSSPGSLLPQRVGSPPPLDRSDTPQIQRSRAELMPKEARAQEFSRVTAYFICEEFDNTALMEFLKNTHEVKPRLYDEALYVPYALPLLPGSDGFRVKSNDTAKSLPSKRYMEKMIRKSEETDHLYEYYSGVETPEDAMNYSMDPEDGNAENYGPFDPSEPQFFAPPQDIEDDSNSEGETSSKKSEANSESLKPESLSRMNKDDAQEEISKHHAEMFVLEYGIIVFWNFTEIHEKNILADLAFSEVPILINPISDHEIETEEFHFEYDSLVQRPRIYNDMITLRSADHLIKLTMSYALAQLTKLCLFESRMVHSLQLISKLPKKLALTGKLGLKRQQLLKKSGKLFKLRVDVNLSSSILDTPNFFWSLEPALHPLYNAVRDYLEIEQRVLVLNDRCKVFLEFSNIISDSINESNTSRITTMIIIIIVISVSVSIFEFMLQLF
ncbi:hypothetical protein C7M61_002455 [Candidozyma pseudohaemuli]|uniref:DUF155 domain-containing protein n=1 Tax=Candidozyma pseudohaemuli TaxID=418784 RepID=A0A2P7YRD4_9ASCO|nr:hypothetical protein C7M61_002455 [[Candida] pseudohaemulonii]PSK38522.1 hypothetical protein C7M61_002455 [[Candida] pseudohaemulonii]